MFFRQFVYQCLEPKASIEALYCTVLYCTDVILVRFFVAGTSSTDVCKFAHYGFSHGSVKTLYVLYCTVLYCTDVPLNCTGTEMVVQQLLLTVLKCVLVL